MTLPGVPTTTCAPRFEVLDLRGHRRATIDGRQPDAAVPDDPANLGAHLSGQLPRRHQDDCLHVAVRAVHLLGQRNAEPRRLARARLGLPHQVYAA